VGEPAFPVSSIDGFTQHGMDLRDWFAGQALAGLLANAVSFDAHMQGDPELIASVAGTFADAMLAARKEASA
jgi:hypothetical protein